jgi:hypothetical protein
VASPSIERTLGLALCTTAVTWAVLVIASPWLASAPPREGGLAYLSASMYWLGALVCHQRPDRSFHVGSVQWPVCARCTGLYLSAALGIVFAWRRHRCAPLPFAAWRGRLMWAALPTAATLAVEWWDPALTPGLVRAVAAVPLGAAAGVLLAESSEFRGRLERCERTRQNA